MKKVIFSILILLLCGCTNYEYNNNLDKIILNIDSINLNEEIHISSILNDVNGIVLFEEYGRPNIENSNTIIGAHSGIGPNAYFNYLTNVNIGDEIKLTYYEIDYIYQVTNIYEVDEIDMSPLDIKEYSMLTLMTCKIGNSSKRIIVESMLISNI